MDTMGVRATIYLISPDAYQAAVRQDLAAFDTDHEIAADLDKGWHAIHYLVTGDHEFRFLIGGVQLEAVSEPCEAHSPESIAALNQRLAKTTAEVLMAKFDPELFNTHNIYQGPWNAAYKASYIHQHLTKFISVVRQAAEQGKGIFVVLA
jgi:hypothetical protein